MNEIENALRQVREARWRIAAAKRELEAAERRLTSADAALMAVHPGNPTSPYAPEKMHARQEMFHG